MFTIHFAESVIEDLAGLRAFERAEILQRVDEQLAHQPTQMTRHKKRLEGLIPPWEHIPPVWQLRVGDFRVFYEVDEEGLKVIIRAIRQKPPHATTEEIL